MVDRQIEARGIVDPLILAAMRAVPREAFVPERLREFAYEDAPLPIEAGQTISQPYIVAAMIEAAQIGPSDSVLEVGGGSGYAAAVISRMASRVHVIERHEELVALARQRLARLGYDNVEIRSGDGTSGWPEAAPFDAIIVSASGPQIPEPLKQQLRLGGRLVMPVGADDDQTLWRVKRGKDGAFDQANIAPVRFVPLIGEHGWKKDSGADTSQASHNDPDYSDSASRSALSPSAPLIGQSTKGAAERQFPSRFV
jgi:protein-L-isoaspartate(D-aspartate) O-methyltransferase